METNVSYALWRMRVLRCIGLLLDPCGEEVSTAALLLCSTLLMSGSLPWSWHGSNSMGIASPSAPAGRSENKFCCLRCYHKLIGYTAHSYNQIGRKTPVGIGHSLAIKPVVTKMLLLSLGKIISQGIWSPIKATTWSPWQTGITTSAPIGLRRPASAARPWGVAWTPRAFGRPLAWMWAGLLQEELLKLLSDGINNVCFIRWTWRLISYELRMKLQLLLFLCNSC